MLAGGAYIVFGNVISYLNSKLKELEVSYINVVPQYSETTANMLVQCIFNFNLVYIMFATIKAIISIRRSKHNGKSYK
ncbi:MAG: hypothetical protein E7385_01670 [Ruminococcaceae bacterium]|nr:hypothetical protein [Oscillospiraceae bacterium]